MNKNSLSWRSARAICIVKTLAKSGHYPTRKSEKEAWFLSPLRSETQASFSVSLNKNLWYDYGLGKGGNIIDLVMASNNCSAREALNCLQENINFSFCPEEAPQKTSRSHEIKAVGSINHPALLEYLHTRKITSEVARMYCKEVWHLLNNRMYFSLGLQNELGGWELRNKYFKSSSSPKTFTFLRGGFSEILVVLEGMFDLLSLRVLDPGLLETSDILVLNSLGNIKRTGEILMAYREVLLYLDNDKAGKAATQQLLIQYSNTFDKSNCYKNFTDLNDMLIYEKRKK